MQEGNLNFQGDGFQEGGAHNIRTGITIFLQQVKNVCSSGPKKAAYFVNARYTLQVTSLSSLRLTGIVKFGQN